MAPFLVVIYLSVLLLLGIRSKLKQKEEDYFLAGRKLSLVPFFMTLVVTSYGWVLGVGELYYELGISAWLFLSLPYSLFAIGIAVFLSKKAHNLKNYTLSELFFQNYGKWAGRLSVFFILLICNPAMYLLMSAQVINYVFGLPMVSSLVFVSLFSILYLIKGGFQSVIKTDILQFFLMFGGFGMLFISLLSLHGFEGMMNVPETHLSMTGGTYSGWYIISWFLLACFTLIDPNYHQRIYAAKDSRTVRRGLIISVMFWTIFDLFAGGIALFGLSLFPALENPAFLYLEVGKMALNPVFYGLFVVGILSAIMSTTDSFVFYCSSTLSRDILSQYQPLRKYNLIYLGRVSTVFVSIVAMVIAVLYSESSVVELFFDFFPVAVSVLLFPVISGYFSAMRMEGKWVLTQMILSGIVCFLYQIFHPTVSSLYSGFTEIGSIYPGLFLAAILQFVFPKKKKVNRLVFCGPECSGKTTHSKWFSEKYNVVWVQEYLREYFEKLDRPLQQSDSISVSGGQTALEKKLAPSEQIVRVCDTSPLQTFVYHRIYYGQRDPNLERFISNEASSLYILCESLEKWVPDGQRDSPKDRFAHFYFFQEELQSRNIPYIVLRGSEEERKERLVHLAEELGF